MSFNDIFKSSFLENVTAVSLPDMALALALSFCLGLFIYFVYKKTYSGVMFSRTFGGSLVAMTMITTMVILAVTSNVVLSLGMVGALSIVRFRTAIKDPMDLAFLFWSISAGIICGAGFAGIAVAASLFITLLILLFSSGRQSAGTLVLVVNADSHEREDEIMKTVKNFCPYSRTRARNVSKSGLNLAVEVRTSKPSELIAALMKLDFVTDASLVESDGDIL